ncbi:MAG: hypothetical protein IT186_00925 [Acidobacteria bacterium]|nr:hypothetical protein [Acidobacteriota bacterium]MCG3191087.1 hypothetical protein [Thermoanaerobaculia bacterium]
MKYSPRLLSLAYLLPLSLLAQSPAGTPAAKPAVPAPEAAATSIHQIDLEPTGTMFSLDKPVLDGDTYVFRSFPEKTETRIPKSKVKKITQRSRDLEKELVYRLEMIPSGTMLSKDEPVLKGNSYQFHAWKGGNLMTVRKADVKGVTKLQGLEAFKAQEIELGSVALQGEANFKSGVVPASGAPGQAPPAGGGPDKGNWTYQGVPGQTDAYAPAGGTVSRPGDVPKAPAPTPR